MRCVGLLCSAQTGAAQMHEVLLWTGVMGWSEVYGTGSEQRPTQVTLW